MNWIESVRGSDIRPWADGFEVVTHDGTTLFAGGSTVRLAIKAAIEARSRPPIDGRRQDSEKSRWTTRRCTSPGYIAPNDQREGEMSDLLEWVEKSAIENLKTHHACADVIAKDAATTLTIFLAAVGGGLAYGAKAIEGGGVSWLSVGAMTFTAWFLILSLLLVQRCLMFRELPSIYNEPKNLYQPEFSLDAIKEVEIEGLQGRIDAAAQRNAQVATSLNRLRLAAAASPIPVIAAAVVAWKAGA
ncbi:MULTISPECIES: hypothetical protein [unclassified Paraburkholderia]|uniref:hypothetical protein n=1 Tax=unclassified Paraburkholderia TaxID=2615204 RepID=UPI00178D47D5|nr:MULTISPECIES: hypothetical protein [unclassified Paraburkholderia]MBB5447101.1 hypothetical protein [Paraburkholderia sp. WSM4177]MBB5487642.1 hypothetical protein [Paraburkholderia sp. WSM4180]